MTTTRPSRWWRPGTGTSSTALSAPSRRWPRSASGAAAGLSATASRSAVASTAAPTAPGRPRVSPRFGTEWTRPIGLAEGTQGPVRIGRQVMIGASAAGVSAAMASRQAGFTGEIVVVGAEPHPPYERPPLSKQLVDVDDVESALRPIVPADQLRSNQVELRLGLRAQAIDPSAAGVLLGDGEILPADSVLLATGARPRRLNVSGGDLEGICYLRTADDALRLGRRLRWRAPVVVIGAGFVGLEVAAVARDLGREVTVVEALRQLLLGPSVPARIGLCGGAPRAGRPPATGHRGHGISRSRRRDRGGRAGRWADDPGGHRGRRYRRPARD